MNKTELLKSLKPSEYRVMLLIRDYLNETGYHGFTYNGIKQYAYKTGFYREYSDRTLDRTIRKLAEYGFLDRIVKPSIKNPRRNVVVFYPTPKFWAVVEERKHLLDDG